MILDGRVHANITVSNTEAAIGGHLEEGYRSYGVHSVPSGQRLCVHSTGWIVIG